MNDFQKARLKEFCDFYKWPEDQTAQLFECSKAFFECIWRGMDIDNAPSDRDKEMEYYNAPWHTLRQMSYTEDEAFPSTIKAFIDEIKPKEFLLDVGCGVGDALIYAANKSINAHGIEVVGKLPFLLYRLKGKAKVDESCAFEGGMFPFKHFNRAILISYLDHVPRPVDAAKMICCLVKGPIYATPCIDETYDRPIHQKYILKHVPAAFKVIEAHNASLRTP